MNKSEVSKIFIDILQSTPGVFSIKCPYDEQTHIHSECVIVNYRDNVWDFMASITILKNSNLKNIVTAINSLLRFALRKKNQKLGKLNILIGGLNND
ncbi:hypothetical protein EG856_03360 [Mycoplasmopsis phocirhinis]|uniref:Uncharacterized protein n=1 Tax=Mycoplasmopsis phocirhinis TaxID=142650 RepID=A0A4P6MN07_9BACT|nr:hypothetical protein [Mycoplasmopsis phocirhinis]QBF34928.1 hypothetical protein EG856_03360 [Mycoplasmopsis phocirhinis]